MKSSSNKCKNKGRDRISELPDEILVHILSFLPILDAVRTVSIRRFGRLWTLLPSLVFDDSEILKEQLWPGPGDNSEVDWLDRFITFVSNVLMLHETNRIEKFHLLFMDYTRETYDGQYESLAREIKKWIKFAIRKEVRYLDVPFLCNQEAWFTLPKCFFRSQSLVEVDLVNCSIMNANDVHMKSLKKLSLTNVEMTNDDLEELISGSACLQKLVLLNVDGLEELRFTAPNIETLHLESEISFLDCPNLKKLKVLACLNNDMRVGDISSVRQVNIKACFHYDDFRDCLYKFGDAEGFMFEDYFLSSQVKELEFEQTKWKRLQIQSKSHPDHLFGICKILRSSPHLEELIVKLSERYSNDSVIITQEDDMLSLEQSCLMQHLKIVTLHSKACDNLLRLAKFLLKTSINLEKMEILAFKKTRIELRFVKQLLSFPRASSNARIILGSEKF